MIYAVTISYKISVRQIVVKEEPYHYDESQNESCEYMAAIQTCAAAYPLWNYIYAVVYLSGKNRDLRIVHQNIVFALAVKFACLGLGAVGFVNMWWAIFADVGVMILAVLNATRTLKS